MWAQYMSCMGHLQEMARCMGYTHQMQLHTKKQGDNINTVNSEIITCIYYCESQKGDNNASFIFADFQNM